MRVRQEIRPFSQEPHTMDHALEVHLSSTAATPAPAALLKCSGSEGRSISNLCAPILEVGSE